MLTENKLNDELIYEARCIFEKVKEIYTINKVVFYGEYLDRK